jgi:hypothetical protein
VLRYDSPVFLWGIDEALRGESDRGQWTLLPECLDDFIDESNPVRVIDAFVNALDLAEMSFEGVEPAATGRPSHHRSVLLKVSLRLHRSKYSKWGREGFRRRKTRPKMTPSYRHGETDAGA